MAILGASFQIGRSALAAYQSAISVAGQNIANVGNPDHARVSARLAALHGGMTTGGVAPGMGVNLSNLQRHVDEALNARVRTANSEQNASGTRYNALRQLETLYGELSDYDLSTRLNEFFGSFSALQTDPTSDAARDIVITSANAVMSEIQRHRAGIFSQIDDLNVQIESWTKTANAIADEIASLNVQIVSAASAGRGGDAALRDRRDALLGDLAGMVDVRTSEQPNGVLNVYVGSEPLVDYGRSRGLKVESSIQDGVERLEVRFADTNTRAHLTSGSIAAAVAVRDGDLAAELTKVDALARGIIFEVNNAHASGRGLVGYQSITGAYAVRDPDATLTDAVNGLPFPVKNGVFTVHVRDLTSGAETTHVVEVDLDGLGGNDATLRSLASQLNALPGLSASVTADNRLTLRADQGAELAFSGDNSGVLAAAGINTFLDGIDAATFSVNSDILANPRRIAAASSAAAADGSNASRIAAVATQVSGLLSGRSVVDFHDQMTHELAIQANAAENDSAAASAVYDSLVSQRESVSGVSLDEEALNLSVYERAFQGASRFLTVVDSMTQELLTIVS